MKLTSQWCEKLKKETAWTACSAV